MTESLPFCYYVMYLLSAKSSSVYAMATGSAFNGQTRIDGSTAKYAVAKAAKPLRALLANRENVDSLIQSGLLKPNEAPENVIKVLKESVECDPQLFWVLLDRVNSFSNCEEAVRRLRGKYLPTMIQLYLIITPSSACSLL